MHTDEDGVITAFEEKPKEPKSTLASMGIYIFTYEKLRKYLIADAEDPASENDFGKNVIPTMLEKGEMCIRDRFCEAGKNRLQPDAFFAQPALAD